MDDKQRDTARKLKQQGLTYAQIGDMMGFSRQRAQQLVRPSGDILREYQNKAGGICENCKGRFKKLEGHHPNYGSDLIIMLCTSCHKTFDNAIDSAKGTKNGQAKLSDQEVIEIRQKHLDGISIKKLESEYAMSNSQIRRIVGRKNWSHIAS